MKVTNLIEIKALIPLLYLREVFQRNILKKRDIFFHESSHKIFAATMSYNHLPFLMVFLEFDDKETQPQQWRYVKFLQVETFS